MKLTFLALFLSLSLFAYQDCCDTISDSFDPKEIKGEFKDPSFAFDYKVFGDSFVPFSASKTENYSTTVPQSMLDKKEDKSLVEFIEGERTGR